MAWKQNLMSSQFYLPSSNNLGNSIGKLCNFAALSPAKRRKTMKKIAWSALVAGFFTDLGLQIIQIIFLIVAFLQLRSTVLVYGWALISELLAACLVGYVIGKIAKGAELFNVMVYYIGGLVLSGIAFALLPEENWTHVSSFWSSLIQVTEIAGLATGALMAKK